MDIEPALKQVELQEEVAFPFPRAWWWRALYGLFVVVMPVLAFWGTELFLPNWQDGKFGSYIILLLSPKASWGFYPLLAYSIFSYVFLLINFERYSQDTVTRLGIYMGVVLALQFSILSGLFTYSDGQFFFVLVVVWMLPLLVSKIYRWAVQKWGTRRALRGTLIFVIVVIIALIIITSQIFTPVILFLAGLTIASPFWCLLLFLKAAIIVFKNHETRFSPSHGLGLTASLSAYVMAWRFGIVQMYALYNALPVQPPQDCYIATAAAQGHPRFVRSTLLQRSDGRKLHVNSQLQMLKCAELALMAVYPRFHRILRRSYDVVGKRIARRIQGPFLADLAYLSLKPWELLARWLLKLVLPEIDSIAKRMYMDF